MDGIKGQLSDSLQFRLSLWLLLAIVGVALLGGLVSFVLSFNEANELQDDMLRQTAALFDATHLPTPAARNHVRSPDSDPEARLQIALLPLRDDTRRTNPRSRFPSDLVNGLQTRTFNGQTYRVFVRDLGPSERIAVAQQTAVRNEAAGYSAMMALLPFVVLIPVLLLLVAGLIHQMFAPVTALADEIDARDDLDLQPLAENGLLREIKPFVVAINRLLEHVADSIAMQQRFIAAAAHELRTPLTALSLQAERLSDADMADSARQRLMTLRNGIERNRMLLDQLLAYARAQSAAPASMDTLGVHDIFRNLLADLIPLAESKKIDIGVSAAPDLQVVAGEFELASALTNLISNAILYTPPGGCIDLTVVRTDHTIAISVEDNGPGIPEQQRARVCEPFYRSPETQAPGSGLGLSIAKTLIERLGGQLVLTDATRFSTGLRATIILQAEPPQLRAHPEALTR